MKIKLERDKLVPILNQIGRIAGTYKTQKEFGNLKIYTQDKQVIFEIGNNVNFLHLEVEATIIKEGEMCLSALDFVGITTKLVGNVVELFHFNPELNPEAAVITDGTTKVRVALINPNLFIAQVGLANKELLRFSLDGKELSRIANVCLPFEDEPQYIPGLNVKLQEDGKLRCCCCSNASAAMIFVKPSDMLGEETFDITFPTQGFKDLCDIVGKEKVVIEVFKMLVRVLLPNGFITLRILDRTYPKIEKLVPTTFEHRLPVKVVEFNNALSLIDIIAHDGSAFVEYQKNICVISSKAGFCTSIRVNFNNNISLKINRGLFKRAFKLFNQPKLELLYNGYLKPLIIKKDDILLILSVLEQR